MANVSKLSDISGLRLSHQLGIPEKGQCSSGFADALQEEFSRSKVQFSKHAAQRMESRGVEMTPGLLQDLNSAVSKAREKGSRDVVVISSSGAFIVNVPNNTVITTMTGAEMKENIFTNIDSAVLI